MLTPIQILNKYWGHQQFRPLQENIIEHVLQNKDALALLPTGGGKSVCFQVPALAKGGICIVVSPLIALMNDQVAALQQKNIPAYAVHGALYPFQVKDLLQHLAIKDEGFLYVAPERLATKAFRTFMERVNPSLIAIDEAHCISQWGYDFRPAYLNINTLREYAPQTPVIALTASATRKVQEDIIDKLGLHNPGVFRQSFERPNLAYSVHLTDSRHATLVEMVQQQDGCGIVYCRVRNQTRQLAELLQSHGIEADFYHAGLSAADRMRKQQNWLENKTRVIVCTNAFGMGIDKPDVRFVIHAESPDCLENYYQEAGRAGRDGNPSQAALILSPGDWKKKEEKREISFPSYQALRALYFQVMDYLQVPAGSGENQVFVWDTATFLKNFKVDALHAHYGIVALEKCGVWQFSEAFHQPSVLVFDCDRIDLTDLEQHHPELNKLATGLLRAYEGIFNNPVPINEKKFADFMQMPEDEVHSGILALQRMGIVQYRQQRNEPTVRLLLNRMYSDAFAINTSLLDKLKATYIEREAAMKNYLDDHLVCRSKMIAAYFDNPIERDCGICDNCVKKKQRVNPSNLAETVLMLLEKLSASHPTPMSEIKTWGRKDLILSAIRHLQSENKLHSNEKGEVLKAR